MGLDIVPEGDWNGPRASVSYSGFHGFRVWLSSVFGLDFNEMEGMGGNRSWDDPWFTQSLDELVPLLNHSDCDGYIDVADARSVHSGLSRIADRIEARDDLPDHYAPFIEDLLAVLEDCIRTNRRVEFT